MVRQSEPFKTILYDQKSNPFKTHFWIFNCPLFFFLIIKNLVSVFNACTWVLCELWHSRWPLKTLRTPLEASLEPHQKILFKKCILMAPTYMCRCLLEKSSSSDLAETIWGADRGRAGSSSNQTLSFVKTSLRWAVAAPQSARNTLWIIESTGVLISARALSVEWPTPLISARSFNFGDHSVSRSNN